MELPDSLHRLYGRTTPIRRIPMARRPTRRALLTASAAGLTVVACSGPILKRPPPTSPGSFASPVPVPVATQGVNVSPPVSEADGYVAVAPRIFQAGQQNPVSFALFQGIQ